MTALTGFTLYIYFFSYFYNIYFMWWNQERRNSLAFYKKKEFSDKTFLLGIFKKNLYSLLLIVWPRPGVEPLSQKCVNLYFILRKDIWKKWFLTFLLISPQWNHNFVDPIKSRIHFSRSDVYFGNPVPEERPYKPRKLDAILSWRTGTDERRFPRSFSNAAEPGNRSRRRRGGGGRAAGDAGPDAPRGGHAAWPHRVSAHRPGELEAETVEDFSPVCCS